MLKTLSNLGILGRNGLFLTGLVTLLLACTPAVAVPITFTCIADPVTNTAECPAVASQIQVEATNPVANQLRLDISNPGLIDSVLTVIYFDSPDGLFDPGFFSVIETGVDFGGNINPGDLPGGGSLTPPFSTNPVDFAIAAVNPKPQNGIRNGVGDSLSLILTIAGPNDINDVVAAFVSGDLRIGFHVQDIGVSGGSDSLVNIVTPEINELGDDPVVPEPSTWLLMSAGVVALIARRRFIG
jgi:hypothetical protein